MFLFVFIIFHNIQNLKLLVSFLASKLIFSFIQTSNFIQQLMDMGPVLGFTNTTVREMDIPCLCRMCVSLVDTDKEVVKYNIR